MVGESHTIQPAIRNRGRKEIKISTKRLRSLLKIKKTHFLFFKTHILSIFSYLSQRLIGLGAMVSFLTSVNTVQSGFYYNKFHVFINFLVQKGGRRYIDPLTE